MTRVNLRIAGPIAVVAVVTAGLLVGLAGPASAGSGATAAAKCKPQPGKKCKKKKKKKKAVPPVTTPTPVTPAPPTPTARFAVSPASFDFGDQTQSGGACTTLADGDCPDQPFTVTNVGTAASGVPAVSIARGLNGDNDPGSRDGFRIVAGANQCTAALAPSASCTVTVTFSPEDDGQFTGTLNVTGAAGGAGSASLTAIGN